ncbi:MAG: IreB family regulatory phosphoprotein [Clostridia bacterium]|nr:IreB family regulatory phosphoprotein [Clostridia bacterium]
MSGNLGETRRFSLSDAPESAEDIIRVVYAALKAKGHDPIMQIVGYLISGDPTYITSYNNARSLIRRLERDEILEEFVRFYVEEHDNL